MAMTLTTPAEETVRVRVCPEPLNAPPLVVYDTPLDMYDVAPLVRVPCVLTLSEWKVGDGVLQS